MYNNNEHWSTNKQICNPPCPYSQDKKVFPLKDVCYEQVWSHHYCLACFRKCFRCYEMYHRTLNVLQVRSSKLMAAALCRILYSENLTTYTCIVIVCIYVYMTAPKATQSKATAYDVISGLMSGMFTANCDTTSQGGNTLDSVCGQISPGAGLRTMFSTFLRLSSLSDMLMDIFC